MKTIILSNAELLEEAYDTSLSSDATAADGTLSVYSISDLAVDQVLLIGEFGQEGSEIIATHADTAPSGTTITLASNLVKSHPKDTKVYVIPYDQAQFYYSATATGDKTLLATSNINAESQNTVYSDSTYTSGYYFTRFYNSIDSSYSDYSDPIPYGGFDSNTVGYLINMVMKELKKDFNDTLTYDMALGEINACLRFVRGELKRWSNVQTFNYELATTAEDDYTWSLPDDYYDKNSNKSCLQIWLDGYDNLTYKDKKEFDDLDRDSTAGKPVYFTIYDGSVYLTPAVGEDYADLTLYMDYYTDIVEVDSDADEITLARFDMVKHWLKWQIRNITENAGKPDYNDGDWLMFQTILNQAKRRESSGQKYKTNLKTNGIFYRGSNNQPFEIE